MGKMSRLVDAVVSTELDSTLLWWSALVVNSL
jgi:hypothetical protein